MNVKSFVKIIKYKENKNKNYLLYFGKIIRDCREKEKEY